MGKHRLRIATALLIAGLLGALFFAARNRPVELEARYDLSAFSRTSLTELHIVWTHKGQETLRTSYNYAGRAAPEQQTQAVSLPPGQYHIEATLHFSDRPRHTTSADIELDDQDSLVIPFE